ncbi:glycerophosphoinositol permease [Malassezia pachydermatis]|uniref:Metabolite transporter n=1 Tax=Malassezia pachydermatis TaxID=77020 RepID=A0A0M8MUI6_9BASI|nr:metabolite transporter [Malassezia pachydermatis]KOS13871.1 metabolite transporter [Malassezia pachydermatis]
MADQTVYQDGQLASYHDGQFANGTVNHTNEPHVHEEGQVERKRNVLSQFGTVFACGAALFMDGYNNASIGTVITLLKKIYGSSVVTSTQKENLSAIGFAGTVIGMLVFGYYSDAVGRKSGMIVSCLIILVFTALSAGAYYHGNAYQMVQMLIAWRFFSGIGIGAEYPTGSVAAAEQTEEMPRRFQHGPFILATNFMIDLGFVAAAFVPLVLTWICTENHNRLIWRLTLGLGVVPCLLVLPFRFLIKQPKLYTTNMIPPTLIPYRLVLKKYWFRLLTISIVWFIYDFIAYPFGIYSSLIVTEIIGPNPPQWVSLGWAVVINCFYIPGSFIGAMLVDTIGPKKCLMIGLSLQIVIGYIMSGLFERLKAHIAAFCVVYGLFLTFGEFGPGDNLGLLASKSCATSVKGQFYGIAAAIGKIGAFGGGYAITALQNHWTDADGNSTSDLYYTAPFYLGASLGCVSFLITAFLIKERPADIQKQEDEEFRRFLEENGFDMSKIGKVDSNTSDQTYVNQHPTFGEKMVEEKYLATQ